MPDKMGETTHDAKMEAMPRKYGNVSLLADQMTYVELG